jgi:deoxyribose-phosphate aldolase
MYTREQFGKMIDNTLLRPDSTRADIDRLAEESAERHLAAVCVFPCWVGPAAKALQGTDVKVCTVISFPFGADTRAVKNFAVRNAILNGAQEVDVVMNIGKLKAGDIEGVKRDLIEIVDGVRAASGGALPFDNARRVLTKIIIETCYLTDAEKETASKLVRDCGADFIKTSTGTGSGGATVDDVRLIRRAVGPGAIGIKASGGIRNVEQAVNLLNAGANRIGTSGGAAIFDTYNPGDWGK